MASASIITSIVTGGSNNHATVSEEANAASTDFVTQGVVGAIGNSSGVAPCTGSFGVSQDSSPDMGVTVNLGKAYVTGTPSGQTSQTLRARMTSNYTVYAISANASGSTKYDWIYLKLDPTAANNPSAAADDPIVLYTSRSSSNTTDNGTPPTYGIPLAVVTVANGASSITNANITDKRVNTSIGSQGGSLIVTQASSGTNAIIQAAGADANVNLELKAKGTGTYVMKPGGVATAGALVTDASGNVSTAAFIKVSNTSTQTVSNTTGTTTDIALTTTNFSSGNMSLSSNAVTIGTTGTYLITAEVRNTDVENFFAYISINSAFISELSFAGKTSTSRGYQGATGAAIEQLNAGDTVKLRYENRTFATSIIYARLSLVRVG